MSSERIVVTGMSINTPLGDTLPGFLDGLLRGQSAITRWKAIDTRRIYSKVGADLSGYDWQAKVRGFEGRVPPEIYRRLRKLTAKAPWSTKLSALLALDAYLDAGLDRAELDPARVSALVAGHNIHFNYEYEARRQFEIEPDFMDSMLSLHGLDTDQAGTISELLQARGAIYTVGAACASGNVALRAAVDEIRHHGHDVCLVTGAVLDFSPIELHAMAMMGAISFQSFNDTPEQASRPYDTRREGFVPAHGGATLVVESLRSAKARGARIHAELLAVEATSDGNHLPQPSVEGQARCMRKVLAAANLRPEDVDYVSAHATSTPLGDLTELTSIKEVFGAHARRLKINAPKSMLGHTCWAAPAVETVAAILQMQAGELHPSINVDQLDPAVDLDVCANRGARHDVRIAMKNSFGFGGIDSVAILRRWEEKA